MMQKTRILIVDDEPAFIRLLKINLERTGRYDVREENDATRALEAAGVFKPDVILLDMIMPRLHGSDLACNIRSSPSLRKTPIVFLTASSRGNGDSPHPQIAGCTVVAKPASMTQIIDAIETNLISRTQESSSPSVWRRVLDFIGELKSRSQVAPSRQQVRPIDFDLPATASHRSSRSG